MINALLDQTPAMEDSPKFAAEMNRSMDAILAAWSSTTDRLQSTHDLLRREVQRLNDELEIKNRELARKNRLADLGLMASHVAHEVRNGLAPMTLYLSLLRRRITVQTENQPNQPNLQRENSVRTLATIEKIESAVVALETTVNDLLNFAVHREPNRSPLDIKQLLEDVCRSLAPQLAAQSITLEIDAPGGSVVETQSPENIFAADRHQLHRAVLNLVLNAVDAMPTGGELTLTACISEIGLEVEVADSGPGLAEKCLQRVFEPFYTTKNEGVGLGLAIVARIAQAHGGTVTAHNCPQGGAAFTLHLPYPKEGSTS